PDPAQYDAVITAISTENEARDHDVIICADEGARADVSQFRGRCLTDVIDFHQPNPRTVVLASDDRRVGSGNQCRANRRFETMCGGWNWGRRASLQAGTTPIWPVIVNHGYKARRTMKLQNGIL